MFRFVFFFLIVSNTLSAQSLSTYPVRLLSDARDGVIRLRWAARDFSSWNLGNQNGYTLERTEVGRPDSRQVLETDLRPLPLSEWEAISDTLEMALLYAGALYSEEFRMPSVTSGEVTMDDLNTMEESRHGMALLAADLFFEVALAGGIGYEDRSVKAGTSYIYELRINDFAPNMERPFAFSSIHADQRQILPPPTTPAASFQTNTVQLSLDQSHSRVHYTAYFVQRAVEAGPWEQRNDYPLIFFDAEGNTDPNLYFNDSLVDNSSEHSYRFYGRSPFGVDGPVSESVSGYGIPPPMPYQARITNLIQNGENGVRIEWDIPTQAEDLIQGIRIYRAPDPLGIGLLLTPQELSPADRSFFDPEPGPGEYYTIILIDKNGHEIRSRPRLIVLEDNHPPAPPTGMEANMDSTGLVVLDWSPNLEPDHQGYRVYISNQREGHFVQLTPDAITRTHFEHQVTMATTAEMVYFKLKAIDYYGNYSDLSEVVVVERPDLQPPGAALIRRIEGQSSGVYVSWGASPSEDVVRYQLERRPANAEHSAWELIYEFRTSAGVPRLEPNSISNIPSQTSPHDRDGEEATFSYLDTEAQAGRPYHYRILVTDDAGLRTPSRPSTGTRTDDGSRGEITNFRAIRQNNETVLLEFSCIYPVDPEFYQLFRSKNGAPLTTYLQLSPDDSRLQSTGRQSYQIRDTDLRVGDEVSYRLLARWADGGFSQLVEARME